ncbi:isoprenylcysteine carboxylmethyltransferase family protein [Mesorhizobium sp. M0062]|uniref:methyltransferase family protein n=1 Tax=Mesorhizobium sp. M0062 TaxID=2956867 RepID=UPI00333C3676
MKIWSFDFAGRLILMLVFAFFVLNGAGGLVALFGDAQMSPVDFILQFVSRTSSLIFSTLLVTFTIIRLPPRDISLGWAPRIAAVCGTFMLATIAIMVRPAPTEGMETVAALLVFAGMTGSAYCLLWLGRSFSIDAQARRLVTRGPYAVVRHPLYLAESLFMLGAVAANPSPVVITSVVVNFAIQYWRILNEERVLSLSFPEYDSYSRKVPMLIPFSRRLTLAAH